MNASLRTSPNSPAVGEFEISRPKVADDGYFTCTATVEADGEAWSVELGMIAEYRRDMLGFFEDIGRGAHVGWVGEQRWESEFSQLHIAATSDGTGDVTFGIFMRWAPSYEEQRETTLVFPAVGVERFAERLRTLLRLPAGSRFRSFD